MDTNLGQESKFTRSNKITKQLKILCYNPFLIIEQVVFSFVVNCTKDKPLVLNESTSVMVVHDSMHLMEITYVNVGVDACIYESFWAKDSLKHS